MDLLSFFMKPPSAEKQVSQWTSTLRSESLKLKRQIRAIEQNQEKIKKSMKEAAKKGQKDICIILAKELLKSRKAVKKLYTSNTHIMSAHMQMNNQLSIVKMKGALEKSTEVMKTMNNLIKVPELAATMKDLSKQMMKAGIIGEMLDDTMENVIDGTEDMEEESQAEIDKILWEITAGALVRAPNVLTETPGESVVQKTKTVKEDDFAKDIKKRLEALKT